MATVINRTELRLVGMSRSGNHALVNWIKAQTSGRICFLNCAEPKTNPFETCRPTGSGLPYEVNYSGFDLQQERQGKWSAKDALIVSHEDCFLGTIAKGFYEERHDQLVGKSAARMDLLLLRDPFNLFASRLKAGYSLVDIRTALRIWKQHAREFLGERRYLKRNRVTTSYNAWFTDATYRRELAERLHLDGRDAGFEVVADTGGGSSFDGLRFRQCASQMQVLRRWERFAGDVSYRRLFDAEMIRLSDAIFGVIPGTELLFPRKENESVEASRTG